MGTHFETCAITSTEDNVSIIGRTRVEPVGVMVALILRSLIFFVNIDVLLIIYIAVKSTFSPGAGQLSLAFLGGNYFFFFFTFFGSPWPIV